MDKVVSCRADRRCLLGAAFTFSCVSFSVEMFLSCLYTHHTCAVLYRLKT